MEIKRYFTPQEANQTLPLVRRIVYDILDTAKSLRGLQQDVALPDKKPGDQQTVQQLTRRLHDFLRELEDIGCFYKDWNYEAGLVDFPAKINGRDVLLCWRTDEPKLMFYHGMEEGFVGRKPIPPSLLALPVRPR